MSQHVIDLIFILKDLCGYCMYPGLEGGKNESEIRGRCRNCFGGNDYVPFWSCGLSLINLVMWIEWNMKRGLSGSWKHWEGSGGFGSSPERRNKIVWLSSGETIWFNVYLYSDIFYTRL